MNWLNRLNRWGSISLDSNILQIVAAIDLLKGNISASVFKVNIHLIEQRFIEYLTYRNCEVMELISDRNINL